MVIYTVICLEGVVMNIMDIIWNNHKSNEFITL